MIETNQIKTMEDFESLKKGDTVAVEFNKNIHDYPKKPYRFGIFKIFLNKRDTKELILQKKNNIYFNYKMFVKGESICNEVLLIKQGS